MMKPGMVLFHLMQRSLDKLDESIELIRKIYTGELRVAEDMGCFRP